MSPLSRKKEQENPPETDQQINTKSSSSSRQYAHLNNTNKQTNTRKQTQPEQLVQTERRMDAWHTIELR